ncbi:unnamed protein product, partial [Prorocentrum cordatum]
PGLPGPVPAPPVGRRGRKAHLRGAPHGGRAGPDGARGRAALLAVECDGEGLAA